MKNNVKTTLITIIVSMLLILSVFTGCSVSKYNAKIYSNAKDLLLPSFWEDNKANVPNTFVITDRETFDLVFDKDKLDVDFDKQMVCLYIFSDTSPSSREYILDSISVKDGKTTIYFKLTHSNKKDAVYPYKRCLVVIMDKTDTSEVEFVENW